MCRQGRGHWLPWATAMRGVSVRSRRQGRSTEGGVLVVCRLVESEIPVGARDRRWDEIHPRVDRLERFLRDRPVLRNSIRSLRATPFSAQEEAYLVLGKRLERHNRQIWVIPQLPMRVAGFPERNTRFGSDSAARDDVRAKGVLGVLRCNRRSLPSRRGLPVRSHVDPYSLDVGRKNVQPRRQIRRHLSPIPTINHRRNFSA